jgi:hypothetical protein
MFAPVMILDFLVECALASVVTDLYVTYTFDKIYCITMLLTGLQLCWKSVKVTERLLE